MAANGDRDRSEGPATKTGVVGDPLRPMGRRRVLLAGAAGIGLVAAEVASGNRAMALANEHLLPRTPDAVEPDGHCSGYPAIERSWIGTSAARWPMHIRTHETPAGGNGHDTSRARVEHFNPTFHEQCNLWAVNYQSRLSNVGHAVRWFGTFGVGVCREPSLHSQGRAFDLTRIQYTDDVFVDMLWSYKQDVKQRRRYLAVAAHLRWYFMTVITAWHNSAHHNHIHFDNGYAVGPVQTSNRHTDIILVQAACRLLISSSIAMDGVWGAATEAAYREMLRRFDMQCLNPKGSTAHARTFWTFVARHGFYNRAAGAFTYGC